MTRHDDDDPLIDEIYEIRKRISAQFGDDAERLGQHYLELQEQFRDRLLSTREAEAAKKASSGKGKSAA